MNFILKSTIAIFGILILLHDAYQSEYSSNPLNCHVNFITTKNNSFGIAITTQMYKKMAQENYTTISLFTENYSSVRQMQLKDSETLLKNRWKSMKHIFCVSVLIFSDDFSFISRNLRLYGPNMTQFSNIFVLVPKRTTSEEENTNISNFQRDIAFGKLYPPLTLITFIEKREELTVENITFHAICPLCADSLEPPSIMIADPSNFSSDTISNTLETLQSLHRSYNWDKGHGSKALLCYIGFRGNILDTEYHKRIEHKAFWKYERDGMKNGILLGILINLFNFTIGRENISNTKEEGNYSGIYLSPGGDLPTFHIYGRNLVHSHNLNEFFLYCRKIAIISATGWDFFSSPFEYEIWIFIFITGVFYALLHRGRMSYGLDIFWSVIGIPCKSDWRNSKFLSYFLVVLINLNVGYLSVITSKVIIPNREADIETPTDLFQQGYRFVTENATIAGPGFIGYYSRDFDRLKIKHEQISDVIVTVDSCPGTHSPICIAQWAGLCTGLLYANEKAEALLQIPADMREKCHGVKTPFRKYWVAFYSQGQLSPKIYQTHQRLISTGIDVFWEKLHSIGSVYNAYRHANHSTKDQSQPSKLSFETPVLLVFKAYGIMVALCILLLLVEITANGIRRITILYRNRVVYIEYEILW